MSIALGSVALFVHCRQYPTYQLNLTGELCQWVTAMVFLYALVDRLDESKTFVTGRIFDFVLTGMFPVAVLVLCSFLVRRYVKWVFDLFCRCCKVTNRESNWERYSTSPHVAEPDVEAQAMAVQHTLSLDDNTGGSSSVPKMSTRHPQPMAMSLDRVGSPSRRPTSSRRPSAPTANLSDEGQSVEVTWRRGLDDTATHWHWL